MTKSEIRNPKSEIRNPKSFEFLARWIPTVLLLTLPAAAAAGDWPQFRGPGGTAVATDKGLPTTWTATENIRWKADLPGRGLSNPVIVGNKVYVTACTGWQQNRLHVLCFDVATGKQLWQRQFWATGNTGCHPKTCMAAPTPCADDKQVYALFATADLVCLDADGNLAWYRSLVGDYPTITNQVGMAASPVLYKDVLVVPMENAGESFVAGIDTKTGKNLWKVDRSRAINWTTPVVVPRGTDAEVVVQSGEGVAGHDLRTGKRNWVWEAKGTATTPSPTVADDMLLVPSGDLVALRFSPADPMPEVAWKALKLRPGTASPVYHQGRVYTLNSAGVLNCADAAKGEILWQERLKGPFSGSLVLADGRVYAVNEGGTTFVVQVGDEPKLVGTNRLDATILATPAIADGALFLRSDQHLYCIGARK
jgi:outer membrane protein assembly factor BamB